jgi:Carboxypeptidase regulatory-like domain
MRISGRSLRALPFAALLLCLLTALTLWAAAETKITVVVKTLAGRPIDRAEVIVRWKANAKHPRNSFAKNLRTQFESRTDQDGNVSFPGVPQGNIQIQVNAHGYQTFGQIFDIDEEEKTIEVKLNPPQQQYTSH